MLDRIRGPRAVVLVLWLVGSAPGLSAAQRQIAPGQAADTVRAAVLYDWPPHYRVTSEGEAVGFAVDVLEAVAARVGLQVQWVPIFDFPEAIDALARGEVDVIPDFGITEARSAEFGFTRPFDAFRLSAFVRSSDPSVSTLGDLAGRRVAVVRTNAAVDLMTELVPDARLAEFGTLREALFELLSAGVDGLAYPEEVVLALARSAGLEGELRVLPEPLIEVPRAMSVRAADTLLLARLDRGVEELVGSDEYEEMFQRWFVPESSWWTVPRVILLASLLLATSLLGMALWRRHVRAEMRESSEAKRFAEAERRKEQVRFRTLVETAYEGIVVGDADNLISFANRRVSELLGVEADRLIGQSLLEYVDPDHHDRLREGISRRRAGVSDSYEVLLRRPDGGSVWALLSAAPIIGEDGSYEGSIGTLTDITRRVREQKDLEQRERRFRALVGQASDLISTLDRDGVMLYQSPPVERLLGYEPDELLGRSVFDFLHPDELPGVRTRWEALVAEEGSTVYAPAFRFRRKDGSWRIWEATLTNHLADPALEAIVSNARDVTDRLQTEEQLLRAQKMEAVGRLAGGVAHDFNNLLTVVRSQADLILLDADGSEPLRDDVEVIRDAADRAAELTKQLLAFGREQILRPRIVSVNDIVRGMDSLLTRSLGEDIRIETVLTQNPPPIRVDPGQLEQVLLNLAVNARDAMPRGGVLRISTFVEAPDEGTESSPNADLVTRVRIDVTDTGGGIPADIQEKIFEPFFTTKAAWGGTGLGLATSYGIVQQSGGTIEVESEPGLGTTFTIRFPTTDEATMPPAPRPPLSEAKKELEGAVLVVEDNPSVRRVAIRILERAGLKVRIAEDGARAAEMLERESGSLDLVLTDLVLPVGSGWEVVDLVRERYPHIPVIAMSGYADQSPGSRQDLPSDVPFIQKPFSPEVLLQSIRSALKG